MTPIDRSPSSTDPPQFAVPVVWRPGGADDRGDVLARVLFCGGLLDRGARQWDAVLFRPQEVLNQAFRGVPKDFFAAPVEIDLRIDMRRKSRLQRTPR